MDGLTPVTQQPVRYSGTVAAPAVVPVSHGGFNPVGPHKVMPLRQGSMGMMEGNKTQWDQQVCECYNSPITCTYVLLYLFVSTGAVFSIFWGFFLLLRFKVCSDVSCPLVIFATLWVVSVKILASIGVWTFVGFPWPWHSGLLPGIGTIYRYGSTIYLQKYFFL